MKKFYVGIKGLVHDPERGVFLILAERGDRNFWEIPGGRIEGDDSFETTLQREISEEVPGATDIKMGRLLGSERIDHDIAPDTGLVLLLFEVTAKLPDPIVISHEHSDFMWVKDVSEIPDNVSPELLRTAITEVFDND